MKDMASDLMCCRAHKYYKWNYEVIINDIIMEQQAIRYHGKDNALTHSVLSLSYW